MSASVDKTIQVLVQLSRCEPRKVRPTDLEAKAQQAAKWCLIYSSLFLAVNGAFVYFYTVRPPSMAAKFFVVSVGAITAVLALLALVLPMIASFVLGFRWKKLALDSMCEDVRYESELAQELTIFDVVALSEARFWLERKLNRISARTGRFFGEKTAVVGLLATTYSFAGEFGGMAWISRTVEAGFHTDNLGNTLLLWVGAFLFGCSIGAILLGNLAARYRYQIEILDLAERDWKFKKENVTSPSD